MEAREVPTKETLDTINQAIVILSEDLKSIREGKLEGDKGKTKQTLKILLEAQEKAINLIKEEELKCY